VLARELERLQASLPDRRLERAVHVGQPVVVAAMDMLDGTGREELAQDDSVRPVEFGVREIGQPTSMSSHTSRPRPRKIVSGGSVHPTLWGSSMRAHGRSSPADRLRHVGGHLVDAHPLAGDP
jgi:hypothetical protein